MLFVIEFKGGGGEGLNPKASNFAYEQCTAVQTSKHNQVFCKAALTDLKDCQKRTSSDKFRRIQTTNLCARQ